MEVYVVSWITYELKLLRKKKKGECKRKGGTPNIDKNSWSQKVMCWWLGPEVKKHDHEVPGTKVKNFYPVSKEVTLKVLKSNMTYLFFKWALAWEKKKNYQRQEGEVAVT